MSAAMTYAALFPYPLAAGSRRSNGVLQVARSSLTAARPAFERRVLLVPRGVGPLVGDLVDEGVEVIELDTERLYLRRRDARRPAPAMAEMVSAAASLRRALREVRPAVLHAWASSTLPLIPVARAQRVPVVLGVQERGDALPAPVYRLVNAVVSGLVREIVVPASFLLEGLPRAHLVPNPVPPDVQGRAAPAKADRPTVVFTGVVARRKGLHHLVEALPAIARAVPEVVVEINGAPHPEDLDGPVYEADLRRRIAALGLEPSVHWNGPIDDPFPAIGRGWVAVICGDRDIAPLVALETAAAGTPLVVASHGGIRDVFGPDEAAWIEPGDVQGIAAAVVSLLGDAEGRRRLADRARIAAERATEQFDTRLRDVLVGAART